MRACNGHFPRFSLASIVPQAFYPDSHTSLSLAAQSAVLLLPILAVWTAKPSPIAPANSPRGQGFRRQAPAKATFNPAHASSLNYVKIRVQFFHNPSKKCLPTVPLTDYHAMYFAHELTKRCSSDSLEKLAGAVAGAQVDLNPHQVDAALFAFQSPLSKGALLADEVGLGKTIEAGLVLSQRWAERKRRILVIVPSNLRKQWHQELTEKFFLPCRILETKSYNAAVRQGQFRPFEGENIVICSYQFARNKAADVANTAWDLVVMDEAHRLRNVYKPSNVIANTLKLALASKHKLLLV